MAVAADGTVYVSFENIARVLRYEAIDGPAQNLITPREFGRMQRNSALEALADEISLGRRERLGRAKDLGSAAVMMALLLAALAWGAVIAGRLLG